MGIGDMAKDFLNSSEGQNLENDALNKASEEANNLTGGQFQDQINQGRGALSGQFGDQQQGQQDQQGQDFQQQDQQDQQGQGDQEY